MTCPSRFAALALRSLCVDLARAAGAPRGEPLALVITRPGGTVQKESDLLGNTRLDEVSEEARAFGIEPGTTIAAARGRMAMLNVRVVSIDVRRAMLASLAEMALAFGPSTAFDAIADVVLVDITGCAHLFGGERALATELAGRVMALGHACRVAIADGARVAAAIARFAPRARAGPFVVAPGNDREAMRVLPLVGLPLEPDVIAWLTHLGLRTVGDLQRLPRTSLGMRLGSAASVVMPLIDGDDRAPLDVHRPAVIPEERVELEHEITSVDALLFILKTLCDRLAGRLEGRGLASHRLELELALDRAMLPPESTAIDRIDVTLPSPVARSTALFGVLRVRIESYAVRAPIRAVTLRAHEMALAHGTQLELFTPRAKADATLPQLVAELTTGLGTARVGVFALGDSWRVEARSSLVASARTVVAPAIARAIEPTRWLARSLVRHTRLPAHAQLLARHEAIEWWRLPPSSRDFVAAWDDSAHAIAWIEIDRATRAWRVLGWIE